LCYTIAITFTGFISLDLIVSLKGGDPVKVSCLQENLAKGLAVVGRAVATRSTLPVLSNILLSAEQSSLKLAATNLEIGINCWIGAKVMDEGAITVPARLLMEFVNSLPSGPIHMSLDVRTMKLHLQAGRSQATFLGLDYTEFPVIPTAEGEGGIFLNRPLLREMINKVVFAAATDESRPILTGVLAEFKSDQLTLAAADGFRLSVCSAAVEGPATPLSFIVPARSLAELARIMDDGDQPIRINAVAARNQVLFHWPNADLVSQLIEGRFPDYRQIIPKSYTTRTVMDTQAFLQEVKRAFLFARDSANIVRLRITPASEMGSGLMTVMGTSAERGDSVGELDAVVEGPGIEIAFNARYLIDVLSVINAPRVIMETTTASSPGVLRPDSNEDFVHVIMPMHISR